MTIIYLLTRGEYSDYRVIGAFTSYENALARASISEPSSSSSGTSLPAGYDIDELTLDVPLPPHVHGYKLWHVEMFADGAVQWTRVCDPVGREPKTSIIARYPARHVVTPALSIDVWAKDEQHAIKIANEKRAFLLATNQFHLPAAEAGSTT